MTPCDSLYLPPNGFAGRPGRCDWIVEWQARPISTVSRQKLSEIYVIVRLSALKGPILHISISICLTLLNSCVSIVEMEWHLDAARPCLQFRIASRPHAIPAYSPGQNQPNSIGVRTETSHSCCLWFKDAQRVDQLKCLTGSLVLNSDFCIFWL